METDDETVLNWSRCSLEDDFSCIPSNLFCDGEVNCLFPDSLGEDEKNCEDESSGTQSLEKSSSGGGRSSNNSSSSVENRGSSRRRQRNNSHRNQKDDVVVVIEEDEGHQIRQYFLPTASFFFLIWGVVTLLRKCYKCYRSEYGKDDFY